MILGLHSQRLLLFNWLELEFGYLHFKKNSSGNSIECILVYKKIVPTLGTNVIALKVWSLVQKHHHHLGTCWRCKNLGPNLDLLIRNTGMWPRNVVQKSSRWFSCKLMFESHWTGEIIRWSLSKHHFTSNGWTDNHLRDELGQNSVVWHDYLLFLRRN